jgi:cytochrome c oxidase cbb3-type subunit 2
VPRSIHNSHRAILGLAAGIYLVLVVVTAILPAQAAARAYPPKERDPDNVVLQSVARGRELYKGYGCFYCHTQQIRGDERLAAKATVGSRLPSVDWHYWHLYDPRAVSPESVMPAMRWLFKTNEADREPDDVDVLYIDSLGIPSRKLYATPAAQDLVAYILSLTRSDTPR